MADCPACQRPLGSWSLLSSTRSRSRFPSIADHHLRCPGCEAKLVVVGPSVLRFFLGWWLPLPVIAGGLSFLWPGWIGGVGVVAWLLAFPHFGLKALTVTALPRNGDHPLGPGPR